MKTILLFLIALCAPALHAETYYVDATQGNDSNNGKSATVAGSGVGPWKTLAKVAATVYQPGDQILLKCGELWRETLKLASSGTAGQPITVGAYPRTCQTKPLIDGSNPIAAQNWSYYANGIYKASLATTATVLNNTFSSGTNTGTLNGWTKQSPYQDGMIVVSSTCEEPNEKCLRYLSGQGLSNNLLLSPKFSLQAGAGYELSFSLKAPKGVALRIAIKRVSAPYESVGLQDSILGTGIWTSYRLPFIASASLGDARIEIDVTSSYKEISLDNVRITVASSSTITEVRGVFSQGRAVNIAHHPNRGHDPQRPESVYLTIAENADRVIDSAGNPASTYLPVGPDLQLPAGATLGAGTGIRVRVNAWMLDERKLASSSGTHLYLDRPTSFPVEKGWGYYLFGQPWMLDEPGEWYFDGMAGDLYIRMPDDQPPAERVAVAQRDVGIDLSNRAHVVVDGIAIRNVTTGVNMRNTTNVTLSRATINDTLGRGVDAYRSADGRIEHCQIERTAGDAIWAADGPGVSSRLVARQNTIQESGLVVSANGVASLPTKNNAAITAGDDASVIGNHLDGAAYLGIRTFARGLIANNLIENTCRILDDCGAIYVSGQNNASTIRNNLIRDIRGAPDGKPAGQITQGQGIMLDDLTSNVIVGNNTITNADNGIQLHNAAYNVIQGNWFYANRKAQIWLQEQTNKTRTQGDLYDNLILGNQALPSAASTNPSLTLQSTIKTTAAFAAFDDNLYATFLGPQMARENWPGGSALHTFPGWQAARTSDGQPRHLDPNGREVKQAGYAAYRATGGNLVVNGDLRNGSAGWSHWNQTAPYGTLRWSPCVVGYCLDYSAGASASLLISPNFSVTKDNWYRVSFDFKTGADNQPVSVLVRRGGGGQNGYEALAGSDEKLIGSTTWKRHAYTFKALKTVNRKDPLTLDNGARVDFQNLMPGQSISVANLEVVPITSVETSLRTHILVNPSDDLRHEDCPDRQTDSALCDQYAHFADGSAVNWPIAIAPWNSELVYSRDTALIDSDSDGIADAQDRCAATPAGRTVNAAGCSQSQSYP